MATINVHIKKDLVLRKAKFTKLIKLNRVTLQKSGSNSDEVSMTNDSISQPGVESENVSRIINSDYEMFHNDEREIPDETEPLNNAIEVIEEILCDICSTCVIEEAFSVNQVMNECYLDLISRTEFSSSKQIAVVCKVCNDLLYSAVRARQHILDALKKKSHKVNKQIEENNGTQNEQFLIEVQSQPNYSFYCPTCESEFDSLNTLKSHHCEQTVLNNQLFDAQPKRRSMYCDYCNRMFSDRLMLAEHIKDDHPEKLFICNYCKAFYGNKRFLIQHLTELHSDMRKSTCGNCGASFSTWNQIMNHICLSTKRTPLHKVKITDVQIRAANNHSNSNS